MVSEPASCDEVLEISVDEISIDVPDVTNSVIDQPGVSTGSNTELVVSSRATNAEPEAEASPADSADDTERDCDEIPQPPAIYAAAVTSTNVPEPDANPRSPIVWVTIEPVRKARQVVRLNPSTSTANLDGLVRYSVEQIVTSAVTRSKRKRLLVGATRLPRGGVRLVHAGAGLRLGISF